MLQKHAVHLFCALLWLIALFYSLSVSAESPSGVRQQVTAILDDHGYEDLSGVWAINQQQINPITHRAQQERDALIAKSFLALSIQDFGDELLIRDCGNLLTEVESAAQQGRDINLESGEKFRKAGHGNYDLVSEDLKFNHDELSLIKRNSNPHFDMGYISIAIDKQPNVDFRLDVCVVRDVYEDFENIRIATEYEEGELFDVEINVDGNLEEAVYTLGDQAAVFLRAKFLKQWQSAEFVSLKDGTISIESISEDGLRGEFNGVTHTNGNIISGKFDLEFP